jgi:hypothetical protein
MPLHNWIQCNNGDLSYLIIEGKISDEKLIEAWEKIYDQYLLRFGLNKKYERYLQAMVKRAQLQTDYVITKDKFKLTEIEIQNAKIANLEAHFGGGETIEVVLVYVSKWLGYRINTREISVLEYFVILDEYGKANKKVGHSGG